MAQSTLETTPTPSLRRQLCPDYARDTNNIEFRDIGNKALPIYDHKHEILTAIANNDIVILRAETGAGKSTQVPQFLLEAGYAKVVVTQPRIVAARSLSERIFHELSQTVPDLPSDFVGYRTANEGNSTKDSAVEVVTDGLQLMRELSGNGISLVGEILVIDEVHEWNTNMTMLVALAKRNGLKTVIMSATMNTENLAEYLSDDQGVPAPVLDIEGRAFTVEERTGDSVVDEAVHYAHLQKNILIFVPGKPDIQRLSSTLRKKLRKDIAIIPLHGEQSIAEQQAAFGHYESGKIIIATDIAKTSITIDDIDVVIDCGWERDGSARDDVPSLNIGPACKSTLDQRKGRVGRTKPGIYVRAVLEGYPPLPPSEDTPEYDVAAILKNRLDPILLKLLGNAAISLEDLDLMQTPDDQLFEYAKQRLQKLGAMAMNGEVTPTGIEMAQLPVDPHYARMIVESYKFPARIQVMLIAAIVASADTSITSTSADAAFTYAKLTDEQNSDLLAMLDVFIAAQQMTEEELEDHGIVIKKYKHALESFRTICRRLQIEDIKLEMPTADDEDALLHCFISGADEIFTPINRFKYRDRRGHLRSVSRNSPLRETKALLVGQPFDIGNIGKSGTPKFKSLIKGATRVNTQQLIDAAPHRCSYVESGVVIELEGSLLTKKEVCFDGLSTGDYITEPVTVCIDSLLTFAELAVYDTLPDLPLPNIEALRQTIQALYDLQSRTNEPLAIDGAVDSMVQSIAAALPLNIASLQDIDAHLPVFTVADFVEISMINEIIDASPDCFYVNDESINIHYRKGNAYVTIPPHVSIDTVLASTDIEESRLYLRYKNDARRYRTVDELRERLSRKPRQKRRSQKKDPNSKQITNNKKTMQGKQTKSTAVTSYKIQPRRDYARPRR